MQKGTDPSAARATRTRPAARFKQKAEDDVVPCPSTTATARKQAPM